MEDRNGIEIKDGDIIDIHQTVNGQNLFVVLTVEPLDVVYKYDLNKKYEYDKQELLEVNEFEKEIEIIGTIL